MRTSSRRIVAWSAVAVGLIVSSRTFARSVRRVVARANERTRLLPGDALIASPVASLTHAITIHAVPRQVWPWLAQMGAGRGGWYSWDCFDNGGQPSVKSIVPNLQTLTIGMTFPAAPGVTDAFTLVAFSPDRFLVLGSRAPSGNWAVTWAFVLFDGGGTTTRLVVRVRGAAGYRLLGLPMSLSTVIVPLVHLVMERKQLLGIASRAEAAAAGGLA
jgi:hypothetical protein